MAVQRWPLDIRIHKAIVLLHERSNLTNTRGAQGGNQIVEEPSKRPCLQGFFGSSIRPSRFGLQLREFEAKRPAGEPCDRGTIEGKDDSHSASTSCGVVPRMLQPVPRNS